MQKAFQKLKEGLISAPILSYPTRFGQFVLNTEASNFGIDIVCSQDGEERESLLMLARLLFVLSGIMHNLLMNFVSNTAKEFRMAMRMRCRVDRDADVYALNGINVGTSRFALRSSLL